MNALFPVVLFRDHDSGIPRIGINEGGAIQSTNNTCVAQWTLIENLELGAKMSVTPELKKMLGRGTERVLSEKLSVELVMLFGGKAEWEEYRDKLVNCDIDLVFMDMEQDFFLVLYCMNMSVAAELSAKDAYKVLLKVEQEKPQGAGWDHYDWKLSVVRGRCVDENGAPLEGVEMEAEDLSKPEVQYAMTDAAGRWIMILTSGVEWEITWTKPGYVMNSSEITLNEPIRDIGDIPLSREEE